MEPTNIDAVQVSWLWKLLSAVGAIAGVLVAAFWKRMESRVAMLETREVALEASFAKHTDLAEVNQNLRELSVKIDRANERADERGQRLMELLISRQAQV
jgi:hypothetical protein